MTKQEILVEIQWTAAENGGKPLGVKTFEQNTGIRSADWFGKYWKSWGDAVKEAGLEPNKLQSRIEDEHLLDRFAELTQELGRVPVKGDLRLKRQSDPDFPNDKVFERFGAKVELLSRVRTHCLDRGGYDDVLAIIPAEQPSEMPARDRADSVAESVGFVYLIKSGRYYKIGKTNSVGRRERELAIQLPETVRTIHAIRTDDPSGIEAYWHDRFAAKRAQGEWFALDATDVVAFKRRKFQ